MKKNKKFLVGTGLLVISSLVTPYRTKATSDFGTISIANPENPSEGITIMDRNLGATSNDIASSASYGYYYQRGNNYGFSNNQTNMKDELVDLSQYGPNRPYKNSNFVRGYFDEYYQHYSYRASPDNENIRGGGEDSFENQRGYNLNNSKERQGPCPDGYHVPSGYERGLLIKYWAENNNVEYVWSESSSNFTCYLSGNYSDFYNYFHLPIAGVIHAGNGEIVDKIHGSYWSSTPRKNSDYIDSSISLTLHQLYVGISDGSRARGDSIRCFKNTYEPEVTTNNENIKEDNAILTNNLTKTVEFNPSKSSRKTVFNGTYTALKDNDTINYYSIDTKYDPDKNNDYLEKRCEKNKVEMTFYLYIDGELVKSTYISDACTLGQGAGFSNRIDEIIVKKGEVKNVKVEIEIEGSVQEDDIYNFRLSLGKQDKNSHDLFRGESNADCSPIKVAYSVEEENNTKTVTPVSTYNSSDVLRNGYTREMNDAYEFAYNNGITTTNNINKANMNSPLTRIAMAKMLSNYAINVLGKKPDTSKGTPMFNDVTSKLNNQYNNAVTLSYQLGIMGQNIKNNNFRPYDEVTRAEFATALSRMLYGTSDGNPYYTNHLKKLKQVGIISNDNPTMKEKRGYVMIMLMRTAQ